MTNHPNRSRVRSALAKILLAELKAGPHLGIAPSGAQAEAERQVRFWLDSNIIPRISDLLPELRALRVAEFK